MQKTKKVDTNLTPITHPELIPEPDELFYRQEEPSYSKRKEEGSNSPNSTPKELSISDIISSVIEEKGVSLAKKRPLPKESHPPQDDSEDTNRLGSGYYFKKRFAPALFVLFFVSALIITIHALGLHFYSMHTRSMERVIPVGSLVVSSSVPTYTLMVGDIITFRNSLGILITHQIHDIQPSQQGVYAPSFVTKGTENPTPDREIIQSDQVVGRVIFHIPRVGGFLMFLRGIFSGG